MKSKLLFTCVVVVASFASCGPGVDTRSKADRARVAVRRDGIVGGRTSYNDPNVFALLIQYPDGDFICSSTLISHRTLLTAAHCVVPENGNPPLVSATMAVNMDAADAGYFDAQSVRPNPSFNEDKLTDDFAIVVLADEPPVPPKAWNRSPLSQDLAGKNVRVVGYGITDTLANDSGLKRMGTTVLNAINPLRIEFGQVAGLGSTGTCSGDSGGPTFFTFADGVERVIGIHSFHSGNCGQNTDTRVDAYAPTINAWMTELETPSCDADHRCNSSASCTTPDPDCACVDDGTCNAGCGPQSPDPDCTASCVADGVCSHAACATADPDCRAFGDSCGYEAHCQSRLCSTSEQHVWPYCSQACSESTPCPTGFDCVTGQCQYHVLPVAKVGEACTPGVTSCGGPENTCGGYRLETEPRCRQRCSETADCAANFSCTRSDQGYGMCVPEVLAPHLAVEKLKAAGCTSAFGSEFALSSLILLFIRRRARR